MRVEPPARDHHCRRDHGAFPHNAGLSGKLTTVFGDLLRKVEGPLLVFARSLDMVVADVAITVLRPTPALNELGAARDPDFPKEVRTRARRPRQRREPRRGRSASIRCAARTHANEEMFQLPEPLRRQIRTTAALVAQMTRHFERLSGTGPQTPEPRCLRN